MNIWSLGRNSKSFFDWLTAASYVLFDGFDYYVSDWLLVLSLFRLGLEMFNIHESKRRLCDQCTPTPKKNWVGRSNQTHSNVTYTGKILGTYHVCTYIRIWPMKNHDFLQLQYQYLTLMADLSTYSCMLKEERRYFSMHIFLDWRELVFIMLISNILLTGTNISTTTEFRAH